MPQPISAFRHGRDQSITGLRDETDAPSFDVRVLDPARDPDWDALVTKHPLCSVFHTAAWARVLSDSYGHQPVYLIFSQLGKPAAFLPIMEVASVLTGRRGVALPFSDSCDALVVEGFEMKSIARDLSTLARDRAWKYLEVRGGPEFSSAQPAAPTFYGHTLQLSADAQELCAGFSSAVRRNLSKAEGSGLTVQISGALEAVTQFYELHVRTRRRHGAPPQPFRFFDNIYRHLVEPGHGFVALARRGAEPIAAAVFLTQGENAVYKFGASDERFQQYRANNRVMWEAIKYLCASGAKILHFGRTSPNNDGLRRFKRGWGSQEEAIRYWRFFPRTGEWTSVRPDEGSPARHLFRRLPSALNRWAGCLLYPHLD